jgi:hypothetical protein
MFDSACRNVDVLDRHACCQWKTFSQTGQTACMNRTEQYTLLPKWELSHHIGAANARMHVSSMSETGAKASNIAPIAQAHHRPCF